MKAEAKIPYVVGFGIGDYKQVEEMNHHANGVVIGSAIVEQVGKHEQALKDESSRSEAVNEIKEFVKKLLYAPQVR